MVFATTRSSRFFIVLLHLVGVSTHLRPRLFSLLQWNETGIQGVHPASIPLEISDPSEPEFDDLQPHWLQDSQDQKCLGPMGSWAECGDSTLWRIIPCTRRHARRRQWIRWATEEEDIDHKMMERPHAYALQLVDDADYMIKANNRTTESNGFKEDFADRDCLSRRRKDNRLVIVSCTLDRAWFWKLNGNGILHFDKPVRGIRSDSRKSGTKKLLLSKKSNLECVWRNNSEAIIRSCDGRNPPELQSDENEKDNRSGKVVVIQFVRQRHVTLSPNFAIEYQALPEKEAELDCAKEGIQLYFNQANNRGCDLQGKRSSSMMTPPSRKNPGSLPSQVDIAHAHASYDANHTETRYSSRISILPHQSPDLLAKELPGFLGYSNPILLASLPGGKVRRKEDKRQHATLAKKEQMHPVQSLLWENNPPLDKPMVRKIQMNPYIAASKNERWTDPQTGLVYRTDLCQFLGHERKDAGRHTLTGVGQYTKTLLNIKVYGVGFYVSKRDILADPSVEPFASLSSEELRNSPVFFETLRKMAGFSNPNEHAGSFDRTLFLKTNMQLATETMRSSLDADWKMLTPEAKELLIGSSMKARPAGEETLKIIESPDNPSRCSCAQIAPEEYHADPSCCARGTELVFTWRKNGNLEVRLNGIFMDSFPRPDIAEGIFYEYLRTDNPMSFDFLDHVVEGFPFLLAPLSQVKGVATPVISQQYTHHATSPNGNPLMRTIGGFGDAITAQASSIADFVLTGAHELSSTAIEKAKSVGSAARSLGEELERKRELIGNHVSTFTSQAMSSFFPRDQKSLSIPFEWISDTEIERISGQLYEQRKRVEEEHGRHFSQSLCRMVGLATGSISATNATQKLFFSLVHLYLLLLLIASFPTQWTKRTKLVVTRKSTQSTSLPFSESDVSDSDDSAQRSIEIDKAALTPGNEFHIKQRLFVL